MKVQQLTKPKWAKSLYQRLVRKLPDYWAIQLMYLRYFRRLPRLGRPLGYNEKINWRKLYQRNPQFSAFCDKVRVKQEVARLIGREHVIPTLWAGDDPETIPFADLTPPYVIKVNHTSGHHIFVRSSREVAPARIIASLRQKLAFPQESIFREWAYRGVPRKILIEPIMPISDGRSPEDYKFLVYDGKVRYVIAVHDRFGVHQQSFYDRNWTLLPVKQRYPNIEFRIPRPPRFAEMIAIAEKIGARFDFVRVDLYLTPETILFGETTFYPGGGIEPLIPQEWEEILGRPWIIRSKDLAATGINEAIQEFNTSSGDAGTVFGG